MCVKKQIKAFLLFIECVFFFMKATESPKNEPVFVSLCGAF